MRILILALLSKVSYAAIDYKRLSQEMEYLKNNAFRSKASKELKKNNYFQRGKNTVSGNPGEMVDLDQLYFSDSVSSGLAAPEKEPNSP